MNENDERNHAWKLMGVPQLVDCVHLRIQIEHQIKKICTFLSQREKLKNAGLQL